MPANTRVVRFSGFSLRRGVHTEAFSVIWQACCRLRHVLISWRKVERRDFAVDASVAFRIRSFSRNHVFTESVRNKSAPLGLQLVLDVLCVLALNAAEHQDAGAPPPALDVLRSKRDQLGACSSLDAALQTIGSLLCLEAW